MKKKDEWLLILSGFFTCALVTFVAALLLQQNGDSFLWLLPHVAFAGLFLLVAIENQRLSSWVKPVAFWLQGAIAVAMVARMGVLISPILLIVWAAQLPMILPSGRAVFALLSINFLAFVLLPYLLGQAPAWITAAAYVGFQWFAFASSQAKEALQQANIALAQSNQQLAATRLLLAQDASRQERLRIARDLHDSIGHQLTALSLQLEAARHSATVEQATVFTDLKRQVGQVLQDLRTTVRQMRSATGTDLVQALSVLGKRLPGVSLHLPGSLTIANPALAEHLLLSLQEGISNAVRHGKASDIQLTVLAKKPLTLQLNDNGIGLAKGCQPGSGLTGMTERLAPFSAYVRIENQATGGASLQFTLESADD